MELIVVANVRLLVLWLFRMMLMLLMMLGHPCGRKLPRAPIQSCVLCVNRSHGTAVPSHPFNGSRRAGGPDVEGAGVHREALMLIQRMVMQMVMIMVVAGFGRSISARPRQVTNGVFHKRVHVVHADSQV